MLYSVINLRNIRDQDGSWSVNDAHYTGIEIELSPEATIVDIMIALKKADVLYKHITRQSLYLENETGDSFFIRAKRDGRWLWELRPKQEN